MGFFNNIFGEKNEFDAIAYTKNTTGYVCNEDYINNNLMQEFGAKEAFQLNLSGPRVSPRSALSMVGEFKYLLQEYEGNENEEAMEQVVRAVLLFVAEYRGSLPPHIMIIIGGSIPTDLLFLVEKKYGIRSY